MQEKTLCLPSEVSGFILQGIQLLNDSIFLQQDSDRMKDLSATIEKCTFVEEFAGDHMFKGVKLDLLFYAVQVFHDIVDLFPQVGSDEESMFLFEDGLVYSFD